MDRCNELLSSGAVSDVYISRDKGSGQKKIKKVYPFKNREFYETEKRILLAYKTINFPALIDSYVNDKGCVIETEYIEGKTLFCYVKECTRLKQRHAENVMMKLIDAVDRFYKISENRYIIGDLSAHNIIVRNDGEISIIDLNSVCERMNEIKGATIKYFDRELLKNPVQGIKCDIYSLGMLYLFMLTGDTGHEGISKVSEKDAAIINSCVIKKQLDDLEDLRKLFLQKENSKQKRVLFKRSIAVAGCAEFALELAYAAYNSGFRVALAGEGIDTGISGYFLKNCGDFELDGSGSEDIIIISYDDLKESVSEDHHIILLVLNANTYAVEQILDMDIKEKKDIGFVFFKYEKRQMLSKNYIKRLLPGFSIFFVENTKKRIMSYETGYVKYIRGIKPSKEFDLIIKYLTGE